MKKMKIYLGALLLLLSAGAFAQESPAQRGLSLSIGPDGGIPIGSFRDVNKFGIGGSAKLAIPVFTNGDVTVSAGYMLFSTKSFNDIDAGSLSYIPFKGGLRFRTNSGFYIEPQAGYTQIKYKELEGDGKFTYAGNIGYLINNLIDVSARYEALATKGSSPKFIGIRLAYNFNFARVKS